MNTSDNNQEQEQYRKLLRDCAERAIHYVKTDNGWFSMRDSFNELCEKADANKGINHEATIGRRKSIASAVCIQCIRDLSPEANDWLQKQLNDIAEDYQEQTTRRGFHR